MANDENERHSAEEVLLSAIEETSDEKLTGFALRLALSGHREIPREGEPDFLAEAEAALTSPKVATPVTPKRAITGTKTDSALKKGGTNRKRKAA